MIKAKEASQAEGDETENLAEIINVDPAAISSIENGKNYPLPANLENLLDALGAAFLEAFDFSRKMPHEDLLKEINLKLRNNPDRIEDFYKIVFALTK